MYWDAWIPAMLSSGVVGGAGLIGGYFLKSLIEKGLQHGFNRDIEILKSELKSNDSEISALRSGALEALSSRHQELDKRRIKAAETLWSATIQQGRYKTAVAFVSGLNLDAVSKAMSAGSRDAEKVKEFAIGLWDASGIEKIRADDEASPDVERLFVNPLAWDAFRALRAVNGRAGAVLLAMKTGGGPSVLKDSSEVNKLLKSVLPHQSEFIDKFPDSGMYYLLDTLEEKIFSELAKSLITSENDRSVIQQASAIVRITKVNFEELPEGVPAEFKIDPPDLPI